MNRKKLMIQSQLIAETATNLIRSTDIDSFEKMFMQQFINSITTTGGLINLICTDYIGINNLKRLNTAIEELHKAIHLIQMLSRSHSVNITLANAFLEQSNELSKLILSEIYEYQNKRIPI